MTVHIYLNALYLNAQKMHVALQVFLCCEDELWTSVLQTEIILNEEREI